MRNRIKKSPILFSSDGIRGISGQWPFNSEGMYHFGSAISEYELNNRVAKPLVILARDTRPTGKEYAEILANCFIGRNLEVIDLGVAPTPVVAYLTKKLSARLGIVVSASHNPAEYNGIKLIDSSGLRLSTAEERHLETFINASNAVPSISHVRTDQPPSHSEHYIDEYIREQIDSLYFRDLHELVLLVDCANGAVARTGEKLLGKLGASLMVVENDLTGKREINKNCGSEHVRANPLEFIKWVQEQKADYGLAFDGDGDRIVVVDRYGNFYTGDDLLYVLAMYYKERNKLPANTIVTTEMANSGVERSLVPAGIRVVKTKNGDKNLEGLMWGNGYLLGAEQVGNVIINDGMHGSADSLYAISLLLTILQSEGLTLEEVTRSLKKNPQILASIRLNEKTSESRIAQVESEIERPWILSAGTRMISWRSSTQPGLLNIMIEALESDSYAALHELVARFCQKLVQSDAIPSEDIHILDISTRKRL